MPGPPPLRPFGLVLHRDGRWTHEGHAITHEKLRAHFDRSVKYLPEEKKYVVTLQHFRGEIEVEEAAFFVRGYDASSGRIALSDGSAEALDPRTLDLSPHDDALRCRIKRSLAAEGLLARFTQSAQAELWHAVVEREGRPGLFVEERFEPLPEALQ